MKKLFLFLVTFVLMGQFAYSQKQQEIVYLKNGSVIRGTVIEQVPNKSIKVQTADGSIFVYQMNEVEKMTKETSKNTSGTISVFQDSNITGYRGFVDFGYTVGLGDYGVGRIELTTSHGYQFNPYFFAGIGTGIHYYVQGVNTPLIPFFADLRGNFLEGPVVPFIGLKLGYSCSIDDGFYGEGFYAAPSAGVKFMLGNRSAINLSFGYSAQKSDGINMGGFSIKAGIEF